MLPNKTRGPVLAPPALGAPLVALWRQSGIPRSYPERRRVTANFKRVLNSREDP